MARFVARVVVSPNGSNKGDVSRTLMLGLFWSSRRAIEEMQKGGMEKWLQAHVKQRLRDLL